MNTVLLVLRKEYEVTDKHPYLQSLLEIEKRVPDNLELWEINYLWEVYSSKFACSFLIPTDENIQGLLEWLEDTDDNGDDDES